MPEPLAKRLKMDLDTFSKAIEKLIAQGAATIDLAGNVRATPRASKPESWRAGYDAQIAFRQLPDRPHGLLRRSSSTA